MTALQYVTKEIMRESCHLQRPKRFSGGQPTDEAVATIRLEGSPEGTVVLGMPRKMACSVASMMMMGLAVPTMDDMAQAAYLEFVRILGIKACMILSETGPGPILKVPSVFDPWARSPVLGAQTLIMCAQLDSAGEVNLYVDLKG